MGSRRRPGRESAEKTTPFRILTAAPNYTGDDDETQIRILPDLPGDDPSDPFDAEMTLRHSSHGR
jgi:hypothetical protein